MKPYKIILLGRQGLATNIVFHSINEAFGIDTVVIEDPESMSVFLKRRVKKLGIWTVFGQLLFMTLVVKSFIFLSKKRKKEIVETEKLNTSPIPSEKTITVSSINAAETIRVLQNLNPDLVIVNGTRIISKKVLSAIPCNFMNTHAGITPKYRGVHGGYWALTQDDKQHCGVTVHYVDEGIDTGNIISQALIKPTAADNFTTYPLLQLAEGVNLLKKAIEESKNGAIRPIQGTGESHLWYHPTIWQYLYYWIMKGIK